MSPSNRLPLVQAIRRTVPRPRAAGASMVEQPSSVKWVMMRNAQRVGVAQNMNPPRPGEGPAAYNARIRSIVARMTTAAIASVRKPGGAASTFSAAKNAALAVRAAGSVGMEPEKIFYLASLAPSGNFESGKSVQAAGSPLSVFNAYKYGASPSAVARRMPASAKFPYLGAKPAGDAFDDMVNNLETGGAYSAANPSTGSSSGSSDIIPKSPSSSGGSSLTDSQINAISSNVATVLGDAASTVTAALRGQDAVAAAQIQADAQIRLQELRNQAAATTNPATQSAIAGQIAALQAAMAQIDAANSMSPTTMLAIGLAGVAAIGLVYMAARRPRHNPVIYRKSKKGHGHLEPYRYVSARKLRRSR